jgi:hypothetical protein
VREGGKMGSDQYCLRWNSYETNILATFEGLLDSEALSDVTLFCEGRLIHDKYSHLFPKLDWLLYIFWSAVPCTRKLKMSPC